MLAQIFLKNKSSYFVDHISDHTPDILAITEIWLTTMDDAARAECTPPGYILLDQVRQTPQTELYVETIFGSVSSSSTTSLFSESPFPTLLSSADSPPFSNQWPSVPNQSLLPGISTYIWTINLIQHSSESFWRPFFLFKMFANQHIKRDTH